MTALALIACTLTMVIQWLIAQGHLWHVYRLSVVNGWIFIVLNIWLSSVPGQEGVALLVIPAFWGVIAAIIGMHRLRREADEAS